MEQIKSLTIDGIGYAVSQFSDQLQKTVLFYEQLMQESEDLNLEVASLQFRMDKNKAAMMFVHQQMAAIAKTELELLKESKSALDSAEPKAD
jgi:hypothetical protein